MSLFHQITVQIKLILLLGAHVFGAFFVPHTFLICLLVSLCFFTPSNQSVLNCRREQSKISYIDMFNSVTAAAAVDIALCYVLTHQRVFQFVHPSVGLFAHLNVYFDFVSSTVSVYLNTAICQTSCILTF